MAVLVDVHGSCVSRGAFNLIEENEIKVNHNFSRNNIASSMMPPCSLEFEKGSLIQYTSEYSERCMRYALNKKNIDVLMASEASYLVIDFFDFCQPVAGYQDTTFSTYDYTFYNTPVYKENASDFLRVDFLSLPHCLWYGYVDLYFKKMAEKFGGHIILNRLDCSNIFLSQDRKILPIPERLGHFGNAKYNKELALLEEYVIKKYPNIYAVDISKYFIPDYAHNADTTPVHYEANYDVLLSEIYKDIVKDGKRRYYDTMPAQMVADMLSRPISTEDFLKLYEERKVPFRTDTFLDYIFNQQSIINVVVHRKWVADLYNEYASVQEELKGENAKELITRLLAKERIWKYEKDITKTVYTYLCEVEECLKLSVSQLYQNFLKHFEEAIPEKWMIELNVLAIVAPNYEQVSDYLLEYYNAIEDDTAFLKTCLNTYGR